MTEQSTNTYINTNTYTNAYIDGSWCAYRLPCGICEKLERECLKNNSGPKITWTSTSSASSVGPTTITYSPVAPATSFGEEKE